MKKYFALALTFVLLFVMAAPAMAASAGTAEHIEHVHAAPNGEEATVQAACTHKQTVSQVQTTYVLANVNEHSVYKTTVYYCYYCGVFLYSTDATFLRSEDHTWNSWQHVSNTHTGEYYQHYYTYKRTCRICNGTVYENRAAGCTATRCIDPE